METYVALNRQWQPTLSDTKLRRMLTKYRLSQHNLAVEVGQYKQAWPLQEGRLCS